MIRLELRGYKINGHCGIFSFLLNSLKSSVVDFYNWN